MSRQRGFTLMELMIVIAIIGLLVAFAVPAYEEQTTKARRSDGQSFLLQLQGDLERHFFDNNTYPNGLSAMNSFAADTVDSPEGFYQVSMVISTGCPITSCFLLRAVPQDGQASDGNLELNSNGTKTPADKW